MTRTSRDALLRAGIAALATWSLVSGVSAASDNHYSSRSNTSPPYLAPPANAPKSCQEAYTQLDANRDGKLDDDVASGRRKLNTKAADKCIVEGDDAWGHYLKARTLAAMGRFGEAAAEAQLAGGRDKDCRYCPPPSDIHLKQFRENALSDAAAKPAGSAGH